MEKTEAFLNEYLAYAKKNNIEDEDYIDGMIEFISSTFEGIQTEIDDIENNRSSDHEVKVQSNQSEDEGSDGFFDKINSIINDRYDFESMIEELDMFREEVENSLVENGCFKDENIGEMWKLEVTHNYFYLMEKIGTLYMLAEKYSCASEYFYEMINLDNDDHFESRYKLMIIFAIMEDEQQAIKIYERFRKEKSIPMMMYLVALYYKLDELDEAFGYLIELKKRYPEFSWLLKMNTEGNDLYDLIEEHGQDEQSNEYKLAYYAVLSGPLYSYDNSCFWEWLKNNY